MFKSTAFKFFLFGVFFIACAGAGYGVLGVLGGFLGAVIGAAGAYYVWYEV